MKGAFKGLLAALTVAFLFCVGVYLKLGSPSLLSNPRLPFEMFVVVITLAGIPIVLGGLFTGFLAEKFSKLRLPKLAFCISASIGIAVSLVGFLVQAAESDRFPDPLFLQVLKAPFVGAFVAFQFWGIGGSLLAIVTAATAVFLLERWTRPKTLAEG